MFEHSACSRLWYRFAFPLSSSRRPARIWSLRLTIACGHSTRSTHDMRQNKMVARNNCRRIAPSQQTGIRRSKRGSARVVRNKKRYTSKHDVEDVRHAHEQAKGRIPLTDDVRTDKIPHTLGMRHAGKQFIQHVRRTIYKRAKKRRNASTGDV